MTSEEALQLLELTPPFTKAELKTAYRQAQMVWHPDRFPGSDELHAKALARSYLINEAFSQISGALEAGYEFKTTAPPIPDPFTVSVERKFNVSKLKQEVRASLDALEFPMRPGPGADDQAGS